MFGVLLLTSNFLLHGNLIRKILRGKERTKKWRERWLKIEKKAEKDFKFERIEGKTFKIEKKRKKIYKNKKIAKRNCRKKRKFEGFSSQFLKI